MADVSLTATSARAERATREVLANLKKVPATARLAFRMLLKIKVGELRVVLPGGAGTPV